MQGGTALNEYWQHQHGLTPDEKQAFVNRAQADEASFRQSLRTIHSAAENRMLTRVARDRISGTDDDADDARLKNH